MVLKLGAYTSCLHDHTLAAALEVLRANGLTSVEVNTGGFIPSPHCHVDLLLSSEQARANYLGEFSSRGMELTGRNCNGNPLNPRGQRRRGELAFMRRRSRSEGAPEVPLPAPLRKTLPEARSS